MRRIGCVAASHHSIAERLLIDALKAWQMQWCVGYTTEPLLKTGGKASLDTVEQEWHLSSCASGDLWVGADWVGLLFSHHRADVPDDAIRSRLVSAAQVALASCLHEALGVTKEYPLQPGFPKELGVSLDPRLLVTLCIGDNRSLYILLDVSLLDEFFQRVPRDVALVPRANSIGSMRVNVRTCLSFASLAVEEVNGLEVGDVLQGNVSLLRPMTLTVDGDQAFAKGFLARRNNNLAVQLISESE